MTAGLQPTKQDFDNRLGAQALQILQALTQWQQLKTKIDAMQDADLTALGYAAADITAIRALMTDVGTMVGIFTGNAAQGSTPYDFRKNLRLLAGFGF